MTHPATCLLTENEIETALMISPEKEPDLRAAPPERVAKAEALVRE